MPALLSTEHTAFLHYVRSPIWDLHRSLFFLSVIMSLGVKMPSTQDALSPALCSNLASVLREAAAGYQPANVIAESILKVRVQGTVGTP